MNLVKILDEQAIMQPDRIALRDVLGNTNRALTYRSLQRLTERAAEKLLDSGIKKGDRVLLAVSMRIETYVLLLALFRIGAAVVIIDPSGGLKLLKRSLELVKPDAMISTARIQLLTGFISEVRDIRVKVLADQIVTRIGKATANNAKNLARGLTAAIEEVEPEHPALITFTSGSTGMPKAIVRTHGFLLNQHKIIASSLPGRKSDIELTTLPVFVLSALAQGITSVLPDCDMRKPATIDARKILRQIRACGVNRIIASPAFLQRLVEHLDESHTKVREISQVLTGGGPVFPSLLKKMEEIFPSAELTAVYGSTEAEPIAHISSHEMSRDDIRKSFQGNGLLAGRPIDEIELAIVNPDELNAFSKGLCKKFNRLPAYVTGEIVVRGKHVVKTYLNGIGDAETKVSAVKHQNPSKIWHRTGDAGYLDAEGRLWLMGRCAVKISDDRGELYPFQVEVAASEMPAVRRATCLKFGAKRVLVIEKKQISVVERIRNVLRRAKPFKDSIRDSFAWLRFDEIKCVDSIPVDERHNSKIQYARLQQRLQQALTH
ncbi:MAG TPA: AMP-binding protein [Candidatus Melainabacteria bacterium]|nr:AMP-binding protein [Candidatus Melainabacteria bacterium]